MKLVTLDNGTADGRLHVVSKDGSRVTPAAHVETMLDAMEHWDRHLADWTAQYDALNAEPAMGAAFDPAQVPPLPPIPNSFRRRGICRAPGFRRVP